MYMIFMMFSFIFSKENDLSVMPSSQDSLDSIIKELLNDINSTIIECDPRLLNLYKRSFPQYSKKFVSIGTII